MGGKFSEKANLESRPYSSPDPSSARKISRGKTKNPFPQKHRFSFCRVRIEAPRTARILGGQNPERKTPFPFSRKNSPPPNQKSKRHFSLGLPRLCEAVAERYERTIQSRVTTRSARAISRRQGCFQNTFELCPTNTAKIRNSNFRQKYGRREAPSVLHSPHKILILQVFATLRVAPRLPMQI